MATQSPIVIVGAGPVGLCAALECERFGIPYVIFEEDGELSSKPKAGTILPRSLEIFAGEGVIDGVLHEGLRFDEVHFVDRRSDRVLTRMQMSPMREETRYPFILNMPQSVLEAVLAEKISQSRRGALHLRHKVLSVEQSEDSCRVRYASPEGEKVIEAQYVLACDGGQSTIRRQLGISMEGITHPERFLVADFSVDLDRRDGRRLTYLSYVFDPEEWVIFVRQPRFWRFLIPVPQGQPEPDAATVIRKIRGVVKNDTLPIDLIDLGVYHVHHRTAQSWRVGRIFLLGDAAHLITPVGGLGLNTGVQDAHNLVWKLAWVMRGWATSDLLSTYEAERAPIARFNARNQADRNRDVMRMKSPFKRAVRNAVLGWTDRSEGLKWRAAYARSLLGTSYRPQRPLTFGQKLRVVWGPPMRPPIGTGDRIPDGFLWGPDGRWHALHDLLHEGFVALRFDDVRNRPRLAPFLPGLTEYLVSPFDAPFESGIRDRTFFDPGGRITHRFGARAGTIYLVRPDGHVGAMARPEDGKTSHDLLYAVTGIDRSSEPPTLSHLA